MAFLEVYPYVTECFKKYILPLISIQDAPQKCKFQPAVNSAHMQRIQATCLISQHSESDFVKLSFVWKRYSCAHAARAATFAITPSASCASNRPLKSVRPKTCSGCPS